MPSFEHVVTVLALATGPAGIWFGWWLSERSSDRRQGRAADEAQAVAAKERAVAVTRKAKLLASASRSLAHGAYLKSTRATPVGYGDMVIEFNERREAYRDALLDARVLGPSWIVKAGEEIEVAGQRMTQRIFSLQDRIRSEDVKRVNDEIPEMDRLVNALVDQLSSRYNSEHRELPERPDLDAVE